MSRFFRTINLVMGAQLRALIEHSLAEYAAFLRRYRRASDESDAVAAARGATGNAPLFVIRLVVDGVQEGMGILCAK
jgi:hypothetical protein